ncbi:RagB/SusD family nutrient uptake outer membrane protein [Rapidithrix thailandica]
MKNLCFFIWLLCGTSCQNYLDVVPDNVATIDHAFSDRVQARKYLFTCYSFLPGFASLYQNPAFLGGDEFWVNGEQFRRRFSSVQSIAQGVQNANEPYMNYYEGSNGASSNLYRGIRVCNTFIERIDEVEDIEAYEKAVWKAEAKFLKAYYHFFLMRMYGPVPLADQNIPVSASPDQVKIFRGNFDECVTFVSGLLDEAAEDLPKVIMNQNEEMGRITKPIALAVKAKLWTMAASPLFNGNPDYAAFINKNGEKFFGAYEHKKWEKAVEACREAIRVAEEAGHILYEFQDQAGSFTEFTKRKLSLRGRVTESWNPEIIWGDSKGNGATNDFQRFSQARLVNGIYDAIQQALSPTLRIARQFYTKHGVPMEEDKTWVGKNVYGLRVAAPEEAHVVKPGEEVPEFHFNREPRFYADLAFDRSVWFGQGVLDENTPYYVFARANEVSGKKDIYAYSITGYFPKKLVYYKNAFNGTNYSLVQYAFPVIRLADLYLLYAEALNEYEGAPTPEVYEFVDKVRARAGLKGVVESWQKYTMDPSKPTTQEGMREIIHRERLIELCFEGQRFWDLRRWKLAEEYLNAPIQGWNIEEKSKEGYYQVLDLYEQSFSPKEYLWPFKTFTLTVNTNLVQNPGW